MSGAPYERNPSHQRRTVGKLRQEVWGRVSGRSSPHDFPATLVSSEQRLRKKDIIMCMSSGSREVCQPIQSVAFCP